VRAAPLVLVIIMDRTPLQGDVRIKQDSLPYPDSLDLSCEGVTSHYALDGVVCHLGLSSKSGHYVTVVPFADGGSLVCDDKDVTRVEEDVTEQTDAYILIYTKVAQPGSPREDGPSRNIGPKAKSKSARKNAGRRSKSRSASASQAEVSGARSVGVQMVERRAQSEVKSGRTSPLSQSETNGQFSTEDEKVSLTLVVNGGRWLREK
jgi:hypothetical protein